MQCAVIGDCCSWGAGGHREAGTRFHYACVKAVVVGYYVVQDLIIIVNRHDLPRLDMNCCRYEHIVLQDGIWHRATTPAEHGRSEQIWPEHIVPLLSDVYSVGGNGDAAGRHSRTAGTLEMTGCAT